MNKRLNIAAITIILAGLCALAFIKLSNYNRNKHIKAWEQQLQVQADTTGQYEVMSNEMNVFISDAVAGRINAVIPYLDSNLFIDGRDVKQTTDPDFAHKAVAGAEQGGYNVGTTFFNDYFKDGVLVEVIAKYDKSSLKQLKTWTRPVETKEFKYTETRYAYSCNIKVEYEVTVDGEEYKGVYYQQSQINSPMDLLYN